MKFRYSFTVVFTIVSLLSGIVNYNALAKTDQQNSNKLQDVTVQFGWLPDVHHSGFWIAKEKGFYKEEGLQVSLLPGGLDSSPIKAVVSGNALIGQVSGIEQLITARAEGLPVKAIATFHRDTPQALISLSRNPIRSSSDLPGKTIAVAYGDAAEILFKAYLAKTGIDQSKINMVPFRFDITPLMTGKVDAITGFSTDQPATLEAKGFKPIVLEYKDAGIRSYGYTFFCTEDALKEQSPLIWKFIKASRRGWEYAFNHPEEAVEIMLKAFPESLTADVEKRKFPLVQKLMVDKDGKLATWTLDKSVIEGAIDNLRKYGQLKGQVLPDELVADKAKGWK